MNQYFHVAFTQRNKVSHLDYDTLHTVISPDRTLKNEASLILPSSIARNSWAPNAKRIFEIV